MTQTGSLRYHRGSVKSRVVQGQVLLDLEQEFERCAADVGLEVVGSLGIYFVGVLATSICVSCWVECKGDFSAACVLKPFS